MARSNLLRGLAQLLFFSFISLAVADTCGQIEAQTSITVSRPLSLAYTSEQNEYWSEACSRLKPSCIIFPKSVGEVSTIFKVLSKNDDKFSVKSGGHNPNLYFSSNDDGPVISLAKLDGTVLDQETGILEVGPGIRLGPLAKKLDGTGWTAVGGRIGNVGLGGLMTGGGLSYLAAQHGWSSSSVLSYEVVLANGTIVEASEQHNVDLFHALKGGGNNFGVVTKFTTQCYKQGQVWGGQITYVRSKKTDEKLLAAARDFTEYNTDEKAAIIVTAERTAVDFLDIWVVFLFYDGPNPPADVFKNFTDVTPLLNTCKKRTYANLLSETIGKLPGLTVVFGTETFPIPAAADTKKVMGGLHEFWRNATQSTLLVPGIIVSVAYQPFPKVMARAARERGYDLYDLDDDADKMILEFTLAFSPIKPRKDMVTKMESIYGGFREMVVAWQKDGTLPADVQLPLYVNDALAEQDFWARMKPESRALAKSVSSAYDPKGIFRERTAGFKP